MDDIGDDNLVDVDGVGDVVYEDGVGDDEEEEAEECVTGA